MNEAFNCKRVGKEFEEAETVRREATIVTKKTKLAMMLFVCMHACIALHCMGDSEGF